MRCAIVIHECDAVAAIENDIQDNVTRLAGMTDAGQIRELCVLIVRQIKDRNNRIRAMK